MKARWKTKEGDPLLGREKPQKLRGKNAEKVVQKEKAHTTWQRKQKSQGQPLAPGPTTVITPINTDSDESQVENKRGRSPARKRETPKATRKRRRESSTEREGSHHLAKKTKATRATSRKTEGSSHSEKRERTSSPGPTTVVTPKKNLQKRKKFSDEETKMVTDYFAQKLKDPSLNECQRMQSIYKLQRSAKNVQDKF